MSSTLIDAMYETFATSKRWFRYGLAGSFTLTVLAAWLAFDPSTKFGVLFSILSLLIQIGVFVCRLWGESCYDVAEQMRRVNTLSDGLGAHHSSLQLAKLLQKTGHATFQPSPASTSYFESQSQPGPKRLAEIVMESAFWTSCLAQTSFLFFLTMSLVGAAISVAAMAFVSLSVQDRGAVQAITNSILPVIAFWSASDVLMLSLKYRKLHHETDRICDVAESIASQGSPDQLEALVLFSDYNCAIASVPPIPGWLYNYKRSVLNQLWQKRTSIAP